MATINLYNVLEYIKQGLIDPTKIKIDLNKNKTASDPNHKWITLDTAIKQGIDFNFDCDVKEIQTPITLPEVVITTLKPKLTPRKINPYITPELISKFKENHWYDYAVKNFKNTFGINPREVADWIPGVGDALALVDINTALEKGNYGEAALGAGFLFVPNAIEKPIRKFTKWVPQSDIVKKLVRAWETTTDNNKLNLYERILNTLAPLEGRIEAVNFAKQINPNAKFIKGTPKQIHSKRTNIDVNATNSPINNTDNIGGYYDPRTNTVFVRSGDNMLSTSFHENLHALGYGLNPENKLLILDIVDPNEYNKLSLKSKEYFLSVYEAPVHSALLGKRWGLKYGQPYPGDDKFWDLKSQFGVGGSPFYFKLDTSDDFRKFWDAITGKYFKY